MKPIIALTMGDPAGVGPELTLRALASLRVKSSVKLIVLGDMGVLTRVAKKCSLKPPREDQVVELSRLKASDVGAGRPTIASGQAMTSYIEEAVRITMTGKAQAMVTAPINKTSAALAGFKFPGHTEFIADITKTPASRFRMMLSGKKLRVVLATIHEPISRVPSLLTKKLVLDTIKVANDSLKKYHNIRRPKIAVAGLNPHAGETHGKGGMGTEEKKIIEPAVRAARKLKIKAVDPIAPDTVFHRAVNYNEFDCVVCMYHDQGLIPLKLLHFEDGVNTTLGLPIIRTSPDHGTAYDLAWKGKANPKSLIAAIEAAAMMARAAGKHEKK
jgi:4-hydroxythreonine-4-phosphate dehydrogenase